MEKPSRILVIEDDYMMRRLISVILERHGYVVLQATQGMQGLELAREHRPQLIVSNYRMPVMNGLELFETLRSSPELAHIPFIFISGDASVKLEKTALLDVADAMLAKPFRMAPFLRTVASLLGDQPPDA